MPWRRCRGRHLWRERIAPPYDFDEEWYDSSPWPADVTTGTLLAWWRPESLSSLVDGAAVTSWADSSGNGRAAAPYTTVKPVWHTNVQNGLGAVLFAGTTDVLGFPQTGNLSSWTIFAVVGALDVVTNAIDYVVAMTGGGTIVGGTDSTFGELGEYQDGTKYKIGNVKPTAWGVDCWQLGHIYRDNTEIGYSAALGTMDRLNLTDLGGRNDIANLGTIGYVGEVLIYAGTLNSTDRTNVHTYLKKRWNTL